MARYLRTFVPGTEVVRPEVGRAAAGRHSTAGGNGFLPPLPTDTGSTKPPQPGH